MTAVDLTAADVGARHPLRDGSTAVVVPRGSFVLLCREVDDEIVWGQSFALPKHDAYGRPDPDEPFRRLCRLLGSMEAEPAAFTRAVAAGPAVRP